MKERHVRFYDINILTLTVTDEHKKLSVEGMEVHVSSPYLGQVWVSESLDQNEGHTVANASFASWKSI